MSALPFRLKPTGDNESAILCPVCGDDGVHIASVEVDRGGSVLTVPSQTEAILSQRARTARGVVLAIEMWGECGHRFVVRLQFHKGTTFLVVDSRPEVGPAVCHDLWR